MTPASVIDSEKNWFCMNPECIRGVIYVIHRKGIKEKLCKSKLCTLVTNVTHYIRAFFKQLIYPLCASTAVFDSIHFSWNRPGINFPKYSWIPLSCYAGYQKCKNLCLFNAFSNSEKKTKKNQRDLESE